MTILEISVCTTSNINILLVTHIFHKIHFLFMRALIWQCSVFYRCTWMWKGKIIKPFFQFSPFLLQTFTCQCFLVYSAARCFVLSSYWTLWMVCTSWIVSIFGIIPAEILSITVDHTFVHLPFFLYEFNAFLHGTFFVAIFFFGWGGSECLYDLHDKKSCYLQYTHTLSLNDMLYWLEIYASGSRLDCWM